MVTFEPEDLQAFIDQDDGQPVVMLNLLRFKADGGRERYQEYLAKAGPAIGRCGADIMFAGNGLRAIAAEPGQSWDAVALVRYPRAFADLVADSGYAEADHLRIQALEEAVLQPVSPMQ